MLTPSSIEHRWAYTSELRWAIDTAPTIHTRVWLALINVVNAGGTRRTFVELAELAIIAL